MSAQSNLFEGAVAYPVTESNVTFSEFDGRFHGAIAYSRIIDRQYRAGVGLEYATFRGGLFDDVDMHVLMPSAIGGYLIDFPGNLDLEGTLRAGFAWIFYRSDSPIVVDIFDESGPYISPGVQLVYTSTSDLRANIGVGYKVIIERFGEEAAGEDSTIRYVVFGGGLAIGI